MVFSVIRLSLALGLAALLGACTSETILRDQDYRPTVEAYERTDLKEALRQFPKKEEKGFITTLEKSWLRFWEGPADPAPLMEVSRHLDERQVTSISGEAKTFLLQETEDGYVPGEHEVVIHHLVTAQILAEQQNWDPARVELKKATESLQRRGIKDTDFDDAALRLWMGTIWTLLGEWDDARVDYRRAAQLNPKLTVAATLAEQPRPPPALKLILTGAGPEVRWQKNALAPTFIAEQPDTKDEAFTASTQAWYDRHLLRNNVAHDFLMTSNYMTQSLQIQAGKRAVQAGGYLAAGTIATMGIVGGGALIVGAIYLAIQSGSSQAGEFMAYLAIIGAGVIEWTWKEAGKFTRQVDEQTSLNEQRGLQNLRTYRFVRFLPNTIGLQPYQTVPVPLRAESISKDLLARDGKTRITFELIP